MKTISQTKLIIFSSIFFTIFYNFKFFKELFATYGFSGLNSLYFLSTTILLISLITLLITIFSSKYTTKAILITLFAISAFTAYFMDTYGVIIDSEMLRNSMQTDLKESKNLLSFKLFLYILFLAIIPIFYISKLQIVYKPIKQEILSKIKTIVLALLIIIIILFSFSKFYTSFFREHKVLRYNVNPIYWLYSVGNYIHKTFDTAILTINK